MSDSYFIGTVSRVHKLWRVTSQAGKPATEDEDVLKQLRDADTETKKFGMENYVNKKEKRPEVGMMVSLDHTIYFHDPRGFRADEWIFTENESPWAGDGRGLVMQRMFTREGKLIATCVQEVSYSMVNGLFEADRIPGRCPAEAGRRAAKA
jgi:acyl-CoA thioesterase 8